MIRGLLFAPPFGWRTLAVVVVAAATTPVRAQTTVTLSTAGTTPWTAPANVTSVTVRAWGGGGSGGTRNGGGAGGGGGGAFAGNAAVAVVPGTAYTITVGAGGAAMARPTASTAAASPAHPPNLLDLAFMTGSFS